VAITDIGHRRRFLAQGNVYLPHIAIIEKIINETTTVKTFHFSFKDEKLQEEFTFESGQFGEFSILGVGESDHLEFAVNRVGKVTNTFHRLGVGAEIGFRGPYGNGFPLDFLQGKNLVFVGGGIGITPLRSLIWNVIDNP